ncbi:hypothetical protein KKC59_02040, partial [bacterium]|nr:hypothetical protein [bacterium]
DDASIGYVLDIFMTMLLLEQMPDGIKPFCREKIKFLLENNKLSIKNSRKAELFLDQCRIEDDEEERLFEQLENLLPKKKIEIIKLLNLLKRDLAGNRECVRYFETVVRCFMVKDSEIVRLLLNDILVDCKGSELDIVKTICLSLLNTKNLYVVRYAIDWLGNFVCSEEKEIRDILKYFTQDTDLWIKISANRALAKIEQRNDSLAYSA